jgi:hypothetical protein
MWGVTSEYDVPLMVSRGMPSLTFPIMLELKNPPGPREEHFSWG